MVKAGEKSDYVDHFSVVWGYVMYRECEYVAEKDCAEDK